MASGQEDAVVVSSRDRLTLARIDRPFFALFCQAEAAFPGLACLVFPTIVSSLTRRYRVGQTDPLSEHSRSGGHLVASRSVFSATVNSPGHLPFLFCRLGGVPQEAARMERQQTCTTDRCRLPRRGADSASGQTVRKATDPSSNPHLDHPRNATATYRANFFVSRIADHKQHFLLCQNDAW